MKRVWKPGMIVPVSGIYKEVSPRRVVIVAGEKFPPTTQKGNGYVIDRATKRKPLANKQSPTEQE